VPTDDLQKTSAVQPPVVRVGSGDGVMNQLVENNPVGPLGIGKHDGVIGPGKPLSPSQSPPSPIARFQGYGTKGIPALPPGPSENVPDKLGRFSEALERLGTDRLLGFPLRVVEILAAAVPFFPVLRVRVSVEIAIEVYRAMIAFCGWVNLVTAGCVDIQGEKSSVS